MAQDSQSTVSSTPETRLLGKIVNVREQIGYIVVPDAKSAPRRYVFRLQEGEEFPTGSIVSFTGEFTKGRTYGKATNVVVAIAAPAASASTTKSRKFAEPRKTSNTPKNSGVRCGR